MSNIKFYLLRKKSENGQDERVSLLGPSEAFYKKAISHWNFS